MTTDVTRTNTAIAPHQGAMTFELEGSMPLTVADIKIPLLRIVQGQSRNVEENRTGQLVLTFSDQAYAETMEFVVVGLTNKSRAKFAQGRTDQPPECSSDDNIMPRSADQAARIGAGPTCAGCRFSQFGPNNEPPPCGEAWNYLGLTLGEDPFPFLFRVAGNGIKHARAYNALFVLTRRPFFTKITRLTTKREANEKGTFYVPQFSTLAFANEDEAAHYAALAREFASFRASASDQDYEGGDVAAGAEWAGGHQELTPDEIMAMRPDGVDEDGVIVEPDEDGAYPAEATVTSSTIADPSAIASVEPETIEMPAAPARTLPPRPQTNADRAFAAKLAGDPLDGEQPPLMGEVAAATATAPSRPRRARA